MAAAGGEAGLRPSLRVSSSGVLRGMPLENSRLKRRSGNSLSPLRQFPIAQRVNFLVAVLFAETVIKLEARNLERAAPFGHHGDRCDSAGLRIARRRVMEF